MEMFYQIQKAFYYGIIQKSILCGLFISIASSLLGIFIVLKKNALISDGLSHVSFSAVVFALALGINPIYVSLPLVIIASIIIYFISEKTHLNYDASIGIISSLSLALGILITSLTKGFNIDIYSYLFGNILAVSTLDVILSFFVFLIVLMFFVIFYRILFLIIFDSDYAKISGINVNFINILINIILSITIIVGIKISGALLMSSFIIFPTVSSLLISKNFKMMAFISVIISIIVVLVGIILSFILNTPSGATIVLIFGIMFIFSLLYRKVIGLI